MGEDKTVYEFGPFRLDTALYRLLRNGETVELEHKVYELLLLLVANRHRVVSREEIQKHLWGHEFISESAIAQCVMKLRRALDVEDMAGEAIENVRGIGYRFAWQIAAQSVEGDAWKVNEKPPLAPPYQTQRLPRLWPLSFIALLGIVIGVVIIWPSRLPEPAAPKTQLPASSAAVIVILPIRLIGGGELLSWIRYGGVSLIGEVVTQVSGLRIFDTAAAIDLNADATTADDELLGLLSSLNADRIVATEMWREGDVYVLHARLLALGRPVVTLMVRAPNSYDALIELALRIAAASEGLAFAVNAAGVDTLAVEERMPYIKALYAVNAHRWRRAQSELAAFFKSRPDFMPALLLSAETELALGNNEAGLAAAKRAAGVAFPPHRVYAVALAAEAMSMLGDIEGGKRLLAGAAKDAAMTADDAAYWHLAQASLLAVTGDFETALGELAQARDHFRKNNRLPSIAESYLREGVLRLERGELIQAEEMSDRAANLAAVLGDRIIDGHSRLLKGWGLFAQGLYQDAAIEIQRAAEQLADVDEPTVELCLLARRGAIALAAGDLEEAKRWAAASIPLIEQFRGGQFIHWQLGGNYAACQGLAAVVKLYQGEAANAWVALSRLLSPEAAPGEPGEMLIRIYQVHVAAQPGVQVSAATKAAWAKQLAEWTAESADLRQRRALALAQLDYLGGAEEKKKAAARLSAALDDTAPLSRVKSHLIVNLVWLLSAADDLDTAAELLAGLNDTPFADDCPVLITHARLFAQTGDTATAGALLDRCRGMWQSGLFDFIGEWRSRMAADPASPPPALPFLLPYL